MFKVNLVETNEQIDNNSSFPHSPLDLNSSSSTIIKAQLPKSDHQLSISFEDLSSEDDMEMDEGSQSRNLSGAVIEPELDFSGWCCVLLAVVGTGGLLFTFLYLMGKGFRE